MADSERRRGKSRKRSRTKKSRLGLWTALVLILLIGSYIGVLELSRPHVTGDQLRFDVFVKVVEDERVLDARILDEDAIAVGRYRRDDGSVARYNAPLLRGSQARLLDLLLGHKVPVAVDQQAKKRIASVALVGLPALMLVVLLGYLILSSRRGTGLFGVRSGARKMTAEETRRVTFADVAGQKEAIAELGEVRQFLADPQRFVALGAQVPKGVLLFGPPGCGKTLLAKALAGEAGASFYSISGSDFVEMYVGVGAARVRELFKEARQNAPAIVFIDELDSIGRARGVVNNVQSHGEQEQALNQILAEMDGFSPTDGILVLGATNRADVLDSALLRPGRFDRKIGLALPDEAARRQILVIHGRTKTLAGNVDIPALARSAIGLSGADLASVMNEGALLAARTGKTAVSQSDLEQALRRIMGDPELQRRLSQRERSIGRRFSEGDADRVTFADVAGQRGAVAELREIKEFLAQPARFSAIGAVVPKGLLLFGPPGCGKTLLARALAGEANAAFFSVSASEFVEVYVGKGAARVREVFAEARSMAPSIVFIDELDAVGRSRGAAGAVTSSGEQDQTLTQILAEMDGFSPTDGIIVLGATNRPDVLDPALLRPGRFDRTIGLALPDEEDRQHILSVHTRAKKLAPDVDVAAIARAAIGLSGADLAGLANEAALLAVRAGRPAIAQADLGAALQRIVEAPGLQRRLSLRDRSIGKRFTAEQRVTFADVAGVDDAIAELAEVKDYLATPERFTRIGAKIPRGILLAGPPGCGKTLLARAVAGEANAAFFSVAGSEFVEVFVGEGASRVRDLFAEAKAMAPAIVFLDEIDAIGARRGAGPEGNREADQTLNQILVELDGFETDSTVIVIAATNRPDILDPALIRPGRFDRLVTVAMPDRAGRRAILDLHGRNKRFGADVDFEAVAGQTRGFSGAELANVLNEAALLAARRGGGHIPMALLEEAIDRARLGVTSRGTILGEDERAMIAYHEAGHALVAFALPGGGVPHKLTIVTRGTALGQCSMVESEDRSVRSRSMLLAELAVGLGGRIAEQLVFGEPGSGAGADLARVNELARLMVCELGMSDALGSLAYANGTSASPEAARAVEAEVRKTLDQAEQQAREVLSRLRPALDAVVAALLDRETLTAGDLDQLLARATPAPAATTSLRSRS